MAHQSLRLTWPKVMKLFSSSAQLRLKFILLINVKMSTTVNYRLRESEPKISTNFGYFSNYEQF